MVESFWTSLRERFASSHTSPRPACVEAVAEAGAASSGARVGGRRRGTLECFRIPRGFVSAPESTCIASTGACSLNRTTREEEEGDEVWELDLRLVQLQRLSTAAISAVYSARLGGEGGGTQRAMTPATKLHSPDSPTTHSVNSLPLSPSPALAPRPTTPPPLASSPDVATAPSDSLLALPDRNSPPRAASPDAASSSPLSLSSSTSSSSPSASTPANANATPPPRRVKLYRLQEDQWIDLGTGNCVGIFIDPAVPGSLAPDEGAWIVVSKEPSPTNSDSVDVDVLLRSRIESAGTQLDDEEDSYDDAEKACNFGAYQKQQDTLIVWTDKLTEMEMALSFATNSGCAEIWSFIKHARKWQGESTFTLSLSSRLFVLLT